MLDLLNSIPRGLLVTMTSTLAVIVICYVSMAIPNLPPKRLRVLMVFCLLGAVALLYEVIYLSVALGSHAH